MAKRKQLLPIREIIVEKKQDYAWLIFYFDINKLANVCEEMYGNGLASVVRVTTNSVLILIEPIYDEKEVMDELTLRLLEGTPEEVPEVFREWAEEDDKETDKTN